MSCNEFKKKVQQFWKKNSVISVDRRNGRNTMKIAKKNIAKPVRELLDQDENVTYVETKRGWKLQTDRYVYTKPVRVLYKDFTALHGKISLGNFQQLQPFYISPPTCQEKESCMCMTCLNIHCLSDLMKKVCNSQIRYHYT